MFARVFPVLFLLCNGVLYCVLAWLFFSAPLQWFATLGVELTDAAGYTDLKATYIGLMGALGLFSLCAALIPAWRQPGLVLALVSYLCLALVRSLGLYVDHAGNELMSQLLLIELLNAALALVGVVCQYQASRRPVNPYKL